MTGRRLARPDRITPNAAAAAASAAAAVVYCDECPHLLSAPPIVFFRRIVVGLALTFPGFDREALRREVSFHATLHRRGRAEFAGSENDGSGHIGDCK